MSQLGEPAKKKRRKDEDDINLLYQTNFIDRQGFNPVEAVAGFLDPVLSYAAVLRTIVFTGLGVRRYHPSPDTKLYFQASGILIFWALMSLLPNGSGRRRRRRTVNQTWEPDLTNIILEKQLSDIVTNIEDKDFHAHLLPRKSLLL